MPDKTQFRQKFIEKRQSISAEEHERWSKGVFKLFQENIDQLLPKSCSSVGLYFSFRGEVDTRMFFDYFQSQKKTCFFPRVEKESIKFYVVQDWQELKKGTYGIHEPNSQLSQPQIPDVIFVPGIAFSWRCYRLGFGLGYYDRLMMECFKSKRQVLFIGLAYGFQVLAEIPIDAHDCRLDAVVTEKQVFFKDKK